MSTFEAYPLRFKEIFKQTVWGGGRLRKLFGKDVPRQNKTGESWEIADHGEDSSIVANGRLVEKWNLRRLCEQYPAEILGSALAEDCRDRFPLLVKYIDANDDLSVQVHPGDEYARAHENGESGKAEAWYVIEARPGSSLVLGTTEGTTKDQFRALLEKGQLEKCLRRVEVRPGDIVYLPAGTIHAIGRGIVLAEIQQNSDTTYRVYDWNRVGLDGKPRQLHVDKALDVIDLGPGGAGVVTSVGDEERAEVVRCEYFGIETITLEKKSLALEVSPKCFELLCAVEGSGTIEWSGGEIDVSAGISLLLPATLGAYKLATTDRLRVLRTIPSTETPNA